MVMTMLMAVISRAALVDVRTCNMTMVVEDETWLQRAKATGIPGHSENASSARFLALPPVPSWLHVETSHAYSFYPYFERCPQLIPEPLEDQRPWLLRAFVWIPMFASSEPLGRKTYPDC